MRFQACLSALLLLSAFPATSQTTIEAPALSEKLHLALSCPGRELETETSNSGGSVTDMYGHSSSGSFSTTTSHMQSGVAKVVITDISAILTYPNGNVRILNDVASDDKTIVGSYGRVFGIVKWKMVIDRLTGDIKISSGRSVAFVGTCSVIAPQEHPRF